MKRTKRLVIWDAFTSENKFIILLSVLLVGLTNGNAQNYWKQKANVPGEGRWGAAGFSINGKGYVGTGSSPSGFLEDFWQYNPEDNTWTQKADFAGEPRAGVVSFSIGNKGYVGTGFISSIPYSKDFWEYDPLVNKWTQKADFGGGPRAQAVGFSIEDKGYVGTGLPEDGDLSKDFWEYDPLLDQWTQKADFGGNARAYAAGFSIGGIGYIGTGCCDFKDFWAYDPATDKWTQKADFGGVARQSAVGLSIVNKGYIGLGIEQSIYLTDFWEFDPESNSWMQKATIGDVGRADPVGFSVGGKGYVGTGCCPYLNDFWEYSPNRSLASCSAPTILSSSFNSSNLVMLNWNKVPQAFTYKIKLVEDGVAAPDFFYSKNNYQIIADLKANTSYYWNVSAICSTSPLLISKASPVDSFTTGSFRLISGEEKLFDVYPNPVSQSATILFYLNEASRVKIEITDIEGRLLRVVSDENFSTGSNELKLYRDAMLPGIYILRLKQGKDIRIKKIVILP